MRATFVENHTYLPVRDKRPCNLTPQIRNTNIPMICRKPHVQTSEWWTSLQPFWILLYVVGVLVRNVSMLVFLTHSNNIAFRYLYHVKDCDHGFSHQEIFDVIPANVFDSHHAGIARDDLGSNFSSSAIRPSGQLCLKPSNTSTTQVWINA